MALPSSLPLGMLAHSHAKTVHAHEQKHWVFTTPIGLLAICSPLRKEQSQFQLLLQQFTSLSFISRHTPRCWGGAHCPSTPFPTLHYSRKLENSSSWPERPDGQPSNRTRVGERITGKNEYLLVPNYICIYLKSSHPRIEGWSFSWV